MAPALRQFLREHCAQHPAARTPLVEFVRAFQDRLSARDKDAWPRGRVIAELVQAGFKIGQCDDKRYWLAGVALRGQWTEQGGRLVLAEHA
jgi:hypothetical protein